MGFKPLPPGLAARLIEGYTDTLTPLVQGRQIRVQSSVCPRCGGAMKSRLHESFMFTPDDPLPRSVHSCGDCGYTIDPVSNFVLKMGNPAAVEEALPLIKPEPA